MDTESIIRSAIKDADPEHIPTSEWDGEGDDNAGDSGGGEEEQGSTGDGEGEATEAAGDSGSGEHPSGEGAEGGEPAPERAGAKVEEDAFAKEHGIKLSTDKRKNRIPYDDVKRINENDRKKLLKEITGADIPDGKPIPEVINDLKTYVHDVREENEAYKKEIVNVNKAGELMKQDVESFLDILVQINPDAKQYLVKYNDQARAALEPKEPEPDFDLGNGQKTFSLDGVRNYGKYIAESTRRQVLAEVDKRLRPIDQQRQQQQHVNDVVIPDLQRQVNEARTSWPEFNEHEKEILAAFAEATKAKKPISLGTAYAIAVNTKHKAALDAQTSDRAKVRKEVLDEIAKAPKSTAARSGSQVVLTDGEASEDPVTDAIARSVAEFKRRSR